MIVEQDFVKQKKFDKELNEYLVKNYDSLVVPSEAFIIFED